MDTPRPQRLLLVLGDASMLTCALSWLGRPPSLPESTFASWPLEAKLKTVGFACQLVRGPSDDLLLVYADYWSDVVEDEARSGWRRSLYRALEPDALLLVVGPEPDADLEVLDEAEVAGNVGAAPQIVAVIDLSDHPGNEGVDSVADSIAGREEELRDVAQELLDAGDDLIALGVDGSAATRLLCDRFEDIDRSQGHAWCAEDAPPEVRGVLAFVEAIERLPPRLRPAGDVFDSIAGRWGRIFVCSACGEPVSATLVEGTLEPPAQGKIRYGPGAGLYAIGGGERAGWYVIDKDAASERTRIDPARSRQGCCGAVPDGDVLNLTCPRGHLVGRLYDDCWISLAELDPSAIRLLDDPDLD